jgi:predicted dehydrogenase
VKTSTDPFELAREVKPDVFCFCTPPGVRLPLVEIGIRSGAKLIAFEKPVALTSSEGLAIKQALDAAGVKAVVSHQHRYGEHYKRVKEIIASGAIGPLRTVYGTSTGGPLTCSVISWSTPPGSMTTNLRSGRWARCRDAASCPTDTHRPIT